MRERWVAIGIVGFVLWAPARIVAQTNCEDGNGPLDPASPKNLNVQDLIRKFGAAESATRQARQHYTYKQDVLMQTVVGKSVTGEFHEVTTVSYDSKGKRQEVVTFAAQPSLRGIQLTAEDMEDIRSFMPLILGSDDLPQYNLSYAGQQHVDDLDTYVFQVEAKKEEKGKRYFKGRIWVDAQDFQIVKVCGQKQSGKNPRKEARTAGAASLVRHLSPTSRWSLLVSGVHAVGRHARISIRPRAYP